MAKKIVLLADGTGNAFTTQESNVGRIFQALDSSEKDQIPCYIKGVGTSGFRPWAIFDGATGVGVPSNVRKLYQFLCRNYEEGAEVYMFGFSRGAFTIRTLIGMIESQGLIAPKFRDRNGKDVSLSHEEMQRLSEDTYRAHRDEAIKSWTFLQTPPFVHAMRGFRALADMFNNVTGRKKTTYKNIEKRELNSIEFVGLFDTVEAFGVPLEELRIAIDRVIWPISFRNKRVSRMARVVRHALSLDDERTTFHPLRIEEIEDEPGGVSRPPSDRIKEVWFAGVHSDVGGGYPDSALSHVPLIWMLEELAKATDGLRFRAGAVEGFRGAASALGPLHDSRHGLGVTYRYDPRSTTGKQTNGKDFPPPLVHHSVVERLVLGTDNYAPITLSSDARMVFPDGTEDDIVSVAGRDTSTVYHDRPTFNALKRLSAPNPAYTDLALDKVWWRRVNYFALVTGLVLLALSPLIADPIANSLTGMKDDLSYSRALAANARAFVDLPFASTGWMATVKGSLKGSLDVLWSCVLALPYVLSGGVDALKSILPSYAAWHLDTFKTHPFLLLLLIIVTSLLYRQSGKLQGEIQDYARKAWSFEGRHVAKARDQPAESKTGWLKGLNQKGRLHDEGADGDSEGQAREAQTDGQSATIPETTLFTRFARRSRNSKASKFFHRFGTNVLSTFWSLVLTFVVVVTPVVALSRIVFNFRMGYGEVCKPTLPENLQWISAASPPLENNTSFKTNAICWASGLAVEKGGAYRLTIEITEPWFDRTIMTDVGGFESDTYKRKIFKAPFLRWPSAGWFQPIARIGGDGDIEWPLVSNDGSGPLPVHGEKCTRMPIAYEDTREFCNAHRNKQGKCPEKVIMDLKNGVGAPLSDYDPLPDSEMTAATEAWNSSEKTGDGATCKSIYPRRTFVSDFVAQKTGELFLFVNDGMPVLGFGSTDQFYRNNRGAATVALQRVPLSAPPNTGLARD